MNEIDIKLIDFWKQNLYQLILDKNQIMKRMYDYVSEGVCIMRMWKECTNMCVCVCVLLMPL